jgi:hypothetical protein
MQAEKPENETLSTRQVVDELSDVIRDKLNKGWRRREVLEFLADLGVEIPLSTVRTYLSEAESSPYSVVNQPTLASRSQSQKQHSKRASDVNNKTQSTAKSGNTNRTVVASAPEFMGHEDV